jgi:WD40 repeat protein
VVALRLLDDLSVERHEGEVYGCSYTPDGGYVLSAGWDGNLRLWDAATSESRLSLAVSAKPLSSCACSPDGKYWLSGSMEGLMGLWEGVSQQAVLTFVGHTRPVSSIAYAPDCTSLVTASWDKQIHLRQVGKEREARILNGHTDIVAGCKFTLDGTQVISWSYDGTIRLWDVALGQEVARLTGHTDRVVALALSPDGRFALSGGRDATVRLWDLDERTEIATVNLGAEVRGCFYMLDAESVVIADAVGRLFLMAVPTFEVMSQVQTPYRVLCGELSPTGMQLGLGAEDGLVHFVAIDGFEGASLVVTAVPSMREQSGLFDRFLGKTRLTKTFSYTCPSCRQVVESAALPTTPVPCPRCRRSLRVCTRVPQLQGV